MISANLHKLPSILLVSIIVILNSCLSHSKGLIYVSEERLETVKDFILTNTVRRTEQTSFAAYKHWHKDSELLPSGLLGPVKIVVSRVVELK